MSITTVSDGVLAVIRKHDHFTKDNTTIGNYTPLSRGTDRVAILEVQPSRHTVGTGAPARMQLTMSEWTMVVRIYRRYVDDGTYASILTDFANVLAKLRQYPRLDDVSGVIRSIVTNSSGILARFESGGDSPSFLRVDITLEITEQVDPDTKEQG